MPPLRRAFPLFVLVSLLTGCAMPIAMGAPATDPTITPTLQPATSTRVLVMAPADATATPTPFQPLPPTQAFLPTNTPAPTSTPFPTPTLPPPTPTNTPPPYVASSPGGILQPQSQVNILLLGSDQRPWDSIFRTDTIILATLNPDLGTINLTSFPRDLYINIPGWGANRINTVWGQGGFNLLSASFEHNFGFRPDHYVLINFSSFKKVVDSLGGLDVNVGEPVSDWHNGRWMTIPAGPRQMDADEVLWYARSRKTSNDFARSRRQQEVLQAIFDKMLTLNAIKRVPEFYEIYKQSVTTDLSFLEIMQLLPLATKITDRSNLHHYYIGSEQVWDWISPEGGMVLLPNQPAIMEVLRKALNSP